MSDRKAKELKELVDSAIVTTGGVMPLTLLVYSPAEEAALRAELHGRRNVKSLSIRLADPSEGVDERPLSERFGK